MIPRFAGVWPNVLPISCGYDISMKNCLAVMVWCFIQENQKKIRSTGFRQSFDKIAARKAQDWAAPGTWHPSGPGSPGSAMVRRWFDTQNGAVSHGFTTENRYRIYVYMRTWEQHFIMYNLVVWNMIFLFSPIAGMMIQFDELIFSRGIETTNQISFLLRNNPKWQLSQEESAAVCDLRCLWFDLVKALQEGWPCCDS